MTEISDDGMKCGKSDLKEYICRQILYVMERLTAFVWEHIGDDTTRLIMNRAKWPEIDMDMAVNCIESRRKLKGKMQEWCDEPGLVFPRKLSAEQCSSSATGTYKAKLAVHITETDNQNTGFRLADLTGGLGVDSWFFSKKAEQVLYCEMLPELCKAAKHNYAVLKAENITVRNAAVISETQIAQAESDDAQCLSAEGASVFQTPTQILSDFQPDIVYMDPARRGEGGKKVFLIEDCTPDVLTLKDEIFQHTRHILLKLSPMADITMVCERLGRCCREVHVVAAGGECKELLVWMDREWDQEYTIHAVELHKDSEAGVITFGVAEEKTAMAKPFDIDIYQEAVRQEEKSIYLFEPGKALMKAGAFNLISERFEISKLGISTHYYTFDDEQKADVLKQHGKVFRVIKMEPLDKRTIKAAGKEFPKAEVTARNIPMDTDTLRKKLGVTSGDDAHIFGLKSDAAGMLLLICSVLR
jgi:16S rRNA G966 N2-methylase RsmD